MRLAALLAVFLVFLALAPAFAHAEAIGEGYATYNMRVGDWFTFDAVNPSDRSCPSKAYAFMLTSVNEDGTSSFNLNCTKPVNVNHSHPPFQWYNNSVPILAYQLYDEFLDAHITIAKADFSAQRVTINFDKPQQEIPTATAGPTSDNFTRYCPNPSTEEGKCGFNYQYCVPGQLRMICDCSLCPVPKGAISPCESFCNPAGATPTATPLATLPAATATPAITSTPSALPSAVTGQTGTQTTDSNSIYWMGGALIIVVLIVVGLLSMAGGKPPSSGSANAHHGTHAPSTPSKPAPSMPAAPSQSAPRAQPSAPPQRPAWKA